jgi:MFS family permease
MNHAETALPAAPQAGLAFIFAVVLLDIIGLCMLFPVQAYIVRTYNTDALTVTLLSVVYAAAQFCAAPILGALSDRYGRRPVLLISMAGSALGYVLFGIGGALWVLFLSRLIDGITGGNLSTAQAYIADVSPHDARAKNFALLGVAFGLGFIIGPALGGVLSQVSLAAPAYMACVLSLLSVGAGWVVLPESLPAQQRTQGPLGWGELNPFAPLIGLVRRPELRALFGAHSIFNFVVMGYNTLAPVFLIERFGVSPLNIAGLLVVMGLMNILVQGALVGRLARRFGERPLALVSPLFQAAGGIATAVVPAFWMVYVTNSIASSGASPFRPALSAMMANQVAAEEQGKLNGVSMALASLMSVFGPLWAGAMYDYVAPGAPFWAGAALLVLASMMVARMPAAARRVPRATEA